MTKDLCLQKHRELILLRYRLKMISADKADKEYQKIISETWKWRD